MEEKFLDVNKIPLTVQAEGAKYIPLVNDMLQSIDMLLNIKKEDTGRYMLGAFTDEQLNLIKDFIVSFSLAYERG